MNLGGNASSKKLGISTILEMLQRSKKGNLIGSQKIVKHEKSVMSTNALIKNIRDISPFIEKTNKTRNKSLTRDQSAFTTICVERK